MRNRPTLQLFMRTLALFAFLLVIWPAPHSDPGRPDRTVVGSR
jgi:hypothetical protein